MPRLCVPLDPSLLGSAGRGDRGVDMGGRGLVGFVFLSLFGVVGKGGNAQSMLVSSGDGGSGGSGTVLLRGGGPGRCGDFAPGEGDTE